MLKKHFHPHRYKMIPVHEWEGKDIGYPCCRWFRDAVFANRDDLLDVTIFTDEI
jgi:hypothetical protein